MLNIKLHNKAVAVLVPIDDTKFGNLAIRDAFGLTDGEKYPHYPQLVLFQPKDGRFAVMDPPSKPPPSPMLDSRGSKDKVRLYYNDQTITSFVNSLEVIKDREYE